MNKRKLPMLLIVFVIIFSVFLIEVPDVSASKVIKFQETRNPGFKVWENVQTGNWAYSTYLVSGEYQTYTLSDMDYKNNPIGIISITHQKPTSFQDPNTGQMRTIGPKDTLRLTKVEPRYHDGFRSNQVNIFNDNPTPEEVTIYIRNILLHNTGMNMEQLNLHNKGQIVSEDRYTENWHITMILHWEVELGEDETVPNPDPDPDPEPPAPDTYQTLEVIPHVEKIRVGDRIKYNAILRERLVSTHEIYSSRNVTQQATWTIPSSTAKLTNVKGELEGVSRGLATIDATYNGLTAGEHTTVIDFYYDLEPRRKTLLLGDTYQFNTSARWDDETEMSDVTKESNWTSLEPNLASVSNTSSTKGLVTGKEEGKMVEIQAEYRGRSLSAHVDVVDFDLVILPRDPGVRVGHTQELEAYAYPKDGSPIIKIPNERVTWNYKDRSKVSILDPGVVKGVQEGETEVTATFLGKTDSTNLTVYGYELEIEPKNPTLYLLYDFLVNFQSYKVWKDNGEKENVSTKGKWNQVGPDLFDYYLDDHSGWLVVNPLKKGVSGISFELDKSESYYPNDVVTTNITIKQPTLEIKPPEETIMIWEDQTYEAYLEHKGSGLEPLKVTNGITNWSVSDLSKVNVLAVNKFQGKAIGTIQVGAEYTDAYGNDYEASATLHIKPYEPEARIMSKDEVYLGEEFLIDGSLSYSRNSEDNKVSDYIWEMIGVNQPFSRGQEKGNVIYNDIDMKNEETMNVSLTVIDVFDKIGSTTKEIKVLAPNPVAKFEHRKIQANHSNGTKIADGGEVLQGITTRLIPQSYAINPYSPIVKEEWNISPSEGYIGDLNADTPEIQFIEEGTFTIELSVIDQYGYTDKTEMTVEVTNPPPVAKFSIKEMQGNVLIKNVTESDPEVLQGRTLTITDLSTHDNPYSELVDWKWEVFELREDGEKVPAASSYGGKLEGQKSDIYFNNLGDHIIKLTVTEKWGKKDDTEMLVRVIGDKPLARIKVGGVLKENRRVTLDASESIGSTSGRYSVDHTKTEWDIQPADGQAQSSIRYTDPANKENIEALFHEEGDYKVRVRVTNEANSQSDWAERVITIEPDLKPIPVIDTEDTVYRNPSNGNKATIVLKENSYSTDDVIGSRTWRYKFNPRQDGDFDSVDWIYLSDNQNISFDVKDLGKYLIELEVVEEFDQETLEQFVTPEHRKRAKATYQVTVDNIAPVVNFSGLTKREHAQIVFVLGNEFKGSSLTKEELDRRIKEKVNNKLQEELEKHLIQPHYEFYEE